MLGELSENPGAEAVFAAALLPPPLPPQDVTSKAEATKTAARSDAGPRPKTAIWVSIIADSFMISRTVKVAVLQLGVYSTRVLSPDA
jgi:hypothetical protein